ncbi:MAG TPA: hypothetical protein ENN90_15025 [Mariniphaga anaerophila]|uniref:PD-(D/E)XK endonuclease-like domain-containing protein n=1 Tax=Mariniphaga anaerophila TaxID=1484053 RepID=A0A831PKJ2_9BACT|nr:hypothetical protein [Mariniphaga anaerophila]
MDITFGIHFDQGVYIDYSNPKNAVSFNKLIAGPLGLLNIIERDLGLSGSFLSEMERKVRYREIIARYLSEDSSALIKHSFEIDPEGVTSELLQFRDQLILAGWTPKIKGISTIIDFIARLEETADVPAGTEDRWMAVFQTLQNNQKVRFSTKVIQLHDDMEDMHPFFQKLFEQLQKHEVKVVRLEKVYNTWCGSNLKNLKTHLLKQTPISEIDTNDSESIQILRFKSDAEAAAFLAAQTNAETLKNTVIINRDNRLLDETFNCFGLPVSGSDQINANPLLIQLVKLVAVLLVKPLHVYNFMSYLQVEPHPVPAALRFKLMKVLKDTGGVNNATWNEDLEKFEFKNDETRIRATNFLKIRNFNDAQINRLEAIRLYRALGDWAQKRMMLVENQTGIDDQLNYLKELSNAFADILREHADEFISAGKFNLLLSGIYQPKTFKNYLAQVGSNRVMGNPGQLKDFPETLVWFDFYNESMKPAYYAFLNSLEREKLQKAGIEIWNVTDQVNSHLKMLMNGLLAPNRKVVLLLVDKANGKAVSDHPVYSYLKANMAGLEKLITDVTDLANPQLPGWNVPETNLKDTVKLPEKHEEYQIATGPKIPQRQTESASSLELLIQNPFDWVFQYGAKIQPGNSTQLDAVHTTMVTVAHKFIETLFEDAQNDLQKAKALMEDYPSRLQTVVENTGMILLLDENKFELESFKGKLKNAVEILIQILEDNNLSVEKTEQEEMASIPALNNQEVTGKIDLVLRTSEGKRAIFDLKWSPKAGKYIRKLTENRHIQLALYQELLKAAANAEVDFVAYYLLPDARLISAKNLLGNAVKFVDNTKSSAEILQQVNQSVQFRRMQIEKGIIEEGGGLPLEKLEYFINQNEKGLFLLETEYQKPKIKNPNFYSNFKTFKGEIS